MKYFFIAGERSGDLHASNCIKELIKLDEQAEIQAWGGDYMEQAGAHILVHYRQLAFMGFWEVITNLLTIKKLLTQCKEQIIAYSPDVVVLVDYGGFNMKIAKFCSERGIKVFYYISPKVWAWNTKRALKIKRYVSRMFVILPFEKQFFEQFNYEVDYVGNPLLDAIRDYSLNANFHSDNQLTEKPIVAVLPGSRKQEVNNILSLLMPLVSRFPEYQFVVAGVDNLPSELYQSATGKGVKVLYNQTYDLLHEAHAAVVTSGTATLETALWRVPQVVVYKTSGFSYAIAKSLIKVPFISLVNLIMNKEVVRELIQGELNQSNLEAELQGILAGPKRESVLEDYQALAQIMGNEKASLQVARLIVKYLKEV
ncbi:lipid-A-disaccharide synthase [Cytophagales bacterium LB-30]|uniref:Lipid-A-disaccharide synthase n=1 Tax=Shiella aurantiaca TaxID=3058365 RepID=A0ABT8F6R1_9BACT|nr:lipid-A-disaccharide synthase [Shiella aurantiaca]MDN4165929.1 lipid-A-disaccharide synthase [Shiella aurantiaca]